MNPSAFEIIGPSMVGPSSSHTAGAVRIGLMARHIAGRPVQEADLGLHGSFAATGHGHATDRGLAAGLLGLAPDDERIREALDLARAEGIRVAIGAVDLGDSFHPNTARLLLRLAGGAVHEVIGSSVGGGAVRIVRIDGFAVSLGGTLDAVVMWHQDTPGFLAKVTALLACVDANIATIQTSRKRRHTEALTVIEMDAPPPDDVMSVMKRIAGVTGLRFLPRLEA